MKIAVYVLVCLCAGRSFAEGEDNFRIVGGTNAAEGEAPYQCSIQLRRNSYSHICGCAILSRKWIVTAAHCIQQFNRAQLTILVGTNDLRKRGERFGVEKLIPHSEFSSSKRGKDIGLIRVQGSIKFNRLVQPIEYSKKSPPPNSMLRLTGWGLLHSSGTIPNMLQKINLNSISFETCKTKYRKLGMDLLAGNLCTFTKIGEGACFGDSGGPLTFDGKLVGVVHGGIPCARGYPDIFTEIAYYDRWIRDTININSRDLI